MTDYMDKRVTRPKRVTSTTWGPPPPCTTTAAAAAAATTTTTTNNNQFIKPFGSLNYKGGQEYAELMITHGKKAKTIKSYCNCG